MLLQPLVAVSTLLCFVLVSFLAASPLIIDSSLRSMIFGVSVIVLFLIGYFVVQKHRYLATPSSSVAVLVGPSSVDSEGRPVIQAGRVRCAFARAIRHPTGGILFTSYVGANGLQVSVDAASPLNGPLDCVSLGFPAVAAKGRLLPASTVTNVVTNLTLTASEATVSFGVANQETAQALISAIDVLASNDPGFALKDAFAEEDAEEDPNQSTSAPGAATVVPPPTSSPSFTFDVGTSL
jgi:hypothetical protein